MSTPSAWRTDTRVLGRMSNHTQNHPGPDHEDDRADVSPVEQDAGEDITTDDDGAPVDNPSGG
ncbi:hypothetical protein QE374_002867 [Microbacterium sp. SORGH_AS428]|nr:hypothetical protein [Microbacterium sp. SORGH_AS_0428]